jgi:hypothetical protein
LVGSANALSDMWKIQVHIAPLSERARITF